MNKHGLLMMIPMLIHLLGGPGAAAGASAGDPRFASHPAPAELERVFAAQAQVEDFTPSPITRRDYLKLIADNIDHWKKHQNDAGAIIDPYSKGERQYSTPAFALAAAQLVVADGRDDLLDAATRAMTWATSSLAARKAADGHGDFFIPMLIHARRLLKEKVPPQTLAAWDADLERIVPEQVYNMGLKGMNWNLVSSSGELLRRQDGLVADDQRDAQWSYLNERLAHHADQYFTDVGMYADPGVPLTYDAFGRLWLDDMMASGAYADGPLASRVKEFLHSGGLSTLLLLSPSGEWPSGGRSSHHNWTEAQIIAICEIHAARWKQAGHDDVAGAFKRAAHLAFQSMQRWQRPSGELWIIKNRYEPETRFAFERYSHHSQYNLLPMAMLAMAYQHADEAIAERPAPAEVGGYVFDLRAKFHKVVAAAAGYYVVIDTAGDPHYNATGLQRIHRSGVAFPPLSDSTVADRAYGASDGAGAAMAPGIQWKLTDGSESPWKSLAHARLAEENKPLDQQPGAVREVQLKVDHATPRETKFSLTWKLITRGGDDDRVVAEAYTIDSSGVACTSSISGDPAPLATRVLMPALMFDGIENTRVEIDGKQATIAHRGSVLRYQVESDAGGLRLEGPTVPAHNGMMQALVADLPGAAAKVRWKITLDSAEEKAAKTPAPAARSSFTPGTLWPDIAGVHINAHGGGVLHVEGTYYWFGEHKVAGRRGNKAIVGVSCYTSTDLYNWSNAGIALPVVTDDPAHDLAAGCIIERPKVIYNRNTGRYVMWFHLELRGQGYNAARCGVAVAEHPAGPYTYQGSFRPDGEMSRDMTLFVDDDGKAYQIRASEDNRTMHISLLSDDYLKPAGRFVRAFDNRYMEAPAIFKHGGRYYLIASGCTGWEPNEARSAVADSIWGPWRELGNPCIGPNAELTFGAQSTYALPVAGTPDAVILMFDRWRPQNAIDGRYVWLPVEFDADRPVIRWRDEWDLSVFDSRKSPQRARN